MKLYLISQSENTGYDTYDEAIVAADSPYDASIICPGGFFPYDPETGTFHWGTKDHQYEPDHLCRSWATKPENVTVKLIGTAVAGTKAGVILASFNAG